MPYYCSQCGTVLQADHLLGQATGTIPIGRACGSVCAAAWEAANDETTEWIWKTVFAWHAESEEGMRAHPFYVVPSGNEVLWRYIDTAKLLDLLVTGSLLLSASHLLGDPFEGSLTEATLARLERAEAKARNELHMLADIPGARATELTWVPSLREQNRWEREWSYVSCWHINQHESAAMWTLYGARAESIALRSTFARLQDCLRPHYTPRGYPLCAKVRYIDYSAAAIDMSYNLAALFSKRKSFEHEAELRVVVQDLPHLGVPSVKGQPLDTSRAAVPGIRLHVDLGRLVEAIHVAPTAPAWLASVVEAASRKLGLDVPVVHSELTRVNPIF